MRRLGVTLALISSAAIALAAGGAPAQAAAGAPVLTLIQGEFMTTGTVVSNVSGYAQVQHTAKWTVSAPAGICHETARIGGTCVPVMSGMLSV